MVKMTGPAESKIELKNAKVYIHKQDPSTRSRIIHIDIEHPDINKVIRPGESTFCSGKEGGVFIGLKSDMLERAKKFLGIERP